MKEVCANICSVVSCIPTSVAEVIASYNNVLVCILCIYLIIPNRKWCFSRLLIGMNGANVRWPISVIRSDPNPRLAYIFWHTWPIVALSLRTAGRLSGYVTTFATILPNIDQIVQFAWLFSKQRACWCCPPSFGPAREPIPLSWHNRLPLQ